MQDQKIEQKDEDLVYFFKNFETLLNSGDTDIDSISSHVDFHVFKEYFIRDISAVQQRLVDCDDDFLLYACKHIYNITDWIKLIVANRSLVFGQSLDRMFEQSFGDKRILQNIYDSTLDRWLEHKDGRYIMGLNTYSILDSKVYYRNRFGEWLIVDKSTVFDVIPLTEPLSELTIIDRLNSGYIETVYDKLITNWNNQNYSGVIPDNFMSFEKDLTNPDEYYNFTSGRIQALLSNPVSIDEIERWNNETVLNLEDTVKLCVKAVEIVKKRRSNPSHTLYLLRDCIVFYEIHKTLDLLESRETSCDKLLIGRKMLSNRPDQWGYYIAILEALYEAHYRYPNSFTDFYEEFCRLMDLFCLVNSDFIAVIESTKTYIIKHINTNEEKIVVFDVGFQGTINLFIKYVLDRHIQTPDNFKTDIEVSIGALWSMDLFGGRALDDYFPFLNRIQYMARSDELYHYKYGSLDSGNIQVTMGDHAQQKKAAIELAILVMVTKLLSE